MEAILPSNQRENGSISPYYGRGGLPLEDELILSREIFSSGRSVSGLTGERYRYFYLKLGGTWWIFTDNMSINPVKPRYHLAL